MASSRPTIRDVAQLAGVSHQTVSRVINQSSDVTDETRERVEAAIEELGYVPNAIARSMAMGKTNTLACISQNLTDYTFASIIEGAELEARKHGYFLMSSSAANPASFKELVEDLVGHRRVDGLIIINPYADNRHLYIPKGFPLIFVGAYSRDGSICSVSLDDEKVAYDATNHLISLGHQKIAMITGPMEEDCCCDRADGYRKAFQDAGLSVDESMILEGDWTATSGQEAFHILVSKGKAPTAVFAQNDRMAMGVLRAARELRLNIPDDLAVIGVDDMPLSSYFDPPLTTMHQDMPRIGQEAIRVLMDLIQTDRKRKVRLKIPAHLIVRQSTVPTYLKGGN